MTYTVLPLNRKLLLESTLLYKEQNFSEEIQGTLYIINIQDILQIKCINKNRIYLLKCQIFN